MRQAAALISAGLASVPVSPASGQDSASVHVATAMAVLVDSITLVESQAPCCAGWAVTLRRVGPWTAWVFAANGQVTEAILGQDGAAFDQVVARMFRDGLTDLEKPGAGWTDVPWAHVAMHSGRACYSASIADLDPWPSSWLRVLRIGASVRDSLLARRSPRRRPEPPSGRGIVELGSTCLPGLR